MKQSYRKDEQTIKKALEGAEAYWRANSKNARNMMPIRAKTCGELVGLDTPLKNLKADTGRDLLIKLADSGRQRTTVQSYYAAFKRMLALAGVSTVGWPKSPTPPRKRKIILTETMLDMMYGGLMRKGWDETAALLRLLQHTGMRVEEEALSPFNWTGVTIRGMAFIEVCGKGGHERLIPLTPEAEYLSTDRLMRDKVHKLPYATHLWRWHQVRKSIGLALFTPHSVRHFFATAYYRKSGRDMRRTQAVLGHADINTTARYIGVTEEELSL